MRFLSNYCYFMLFVLAQGLIESCQYLDNYYASITSQVLYLIMLILEIKLCNGAYSKFGHSIFILIIINSITRFAIVQAADFVHIIPNDGNDAGNDIKISGGYLYVAGSYATDPASTNIDIVVYKLNPDGSEVWKYNGGGADLDQAFSINFKGPDIIAVGTTSTSGGQGKYWVVNANGSPGSSGSKSEIGIEGAKIIINSNGGWIIVGRTSTHGTVSLMNGGMNIPKNKDIATTINILGCVEISAGEIATIGNSGTFSCVYTHFDNNLATLHSVADIKFDSGSNTYCHDIIMLSDTNLAIAGYADPGFHGSNKDAFLAKITTTGTIIWKQAIGHSGDEVAMSVRELSDGSFVLGGYVNNNDGNGNQAWIAITNSLGTLLQEKSYGSTGDDQFNSIAIDSGKITAVGTKSEASPKGQDIFIVTPDFCILGTYFDTGSSSTKNCNPGTYQDECGKTSCKSCSDGYVQEQYGKSYCDLCLAGTYQNDLYTKCILCDYGTAQPADGQKACVPCLENFYQDQQGKTACIPCDAGKYQDLQGQTSCKTCHKLCQTCHGGTNLDCDSCQMGIINLDPNSDGHSCFCKDGYFYDSTQTLNADLCQPCGKFCKSCSGTSNYCTECDEVAGVIFYGNTCKCGGTGYFEYLNSVTSRYECVKCNILCDQCTGPLQTQCKACSTTHNAIFDGISTCNCKDGYYFSSDHQDCMPCNSLCLKCTGPANTDCDGCNPTIGVPVNGDFHYCVSDCDYQPGYFKNALGTCVRILQIFIPIACDPVCKSCFNSDADNCLSCTDSTKFVLDGKCIDSCLDHYYATSAKNCEECHSTCNQCFAGGRFACKSCANGLFLYGNECVNACPENTFIDGSECKNCDSKCQSCVSVNDCTKCSEPYYHIPNTYTCTLDCGSGFYQDKETHECLKCDNTCKTCIGPNNFDCTTCDIQQGLIKYTSGPGICQLLSCDDGYYLFLNTTQNLIECRKCHKSCLTCIGDATPNSCLSCKSGLIAVSAGDGINTVSCKTCKQLHEGFYADPSGECKEICGDGINLGQYECDDGNKIDGDGCNSQCKIEEGYKCYKQTNGPDHCYDYIVPYAKLKMKKTNEIEIQFSELIVVNANSDLLSEHMIVWVEGTTNSCPISWKSREYFYKGKLTTELILELKIECGLKGNAEIFYVNITDPYLITDPGKNKLLNNLLEVRSKRFLYISDAEKEIVVGTGETFDFSTMITLGLVVCASLLQSAAVESFWAFLNMVQILSYVPLITCDLPHNLEIFLTEYLSASKISLPFHLLPDWVPQPLDYLKEFITEPLNARYLIAGYQSISFVYNFAEQLCTWVLLLLFYSLLKLACCIIESSKFKLIHKMKKEYEFNTVIRVLIECYMNMSFCVVLNLWMVFYDCITQILQTETKKIQDIISFISSCIGAVFLQFYLTFYQYLAIGFFVRTLWLVDKQSEDLQSEEFKETYGTIIEGLNIQNRKNAKYFYHIFMIRRIYYALILVILHEYPYIQLIVIPTAIILPVFFYCNKFLQMFSYIWKAMPFKGPGSNVLNIFNEGILLAVYLSALFINVWPVENSIINLIGWVLIGLILISLIWTWITTLPNMLKETYQYLKDLCSPKQETPIVTPYNIPQDLTAKSILNSLRSPSMMKHDSTKSIRIYDESPTFQGSPINQICDTFPVRMPTKLTKASSGVSNDNSFHPIQHKRTYVSAFQEKSHTLRTEPNVSTRQLLGGHPQLQIKFQLDKQQ